MASFVGRRWAWRFLKATALAVSPWLVSLLVHAAAMLALGLASTALPGKKIRGSVELTLRLGEADLTERNSQVVLEASARAPALLLPAAEMRQLPAAPATQEANSAVHRDEQTSYVAPVGNVAPGEHHLTTTQVFGIRSLGTRFVYVFDRSASMEGRPLEAAKRQLMASLDDLSPGDQFQIVFYNDQPQRAPAPRGNFHAMLPADEPSKRLAVRFIGGILADGSTNHIAALVAALQMRPDVIYFLTDCEGETLGPDQLLMVRRFNRGTTIHAIEFGWRAPSGAASFLQRLAMENGGQHSYIDVSLLR